MRILIYIYTHKPFVCLGHVVAIRSNMKPNLKPVRVVGYTVTPLVHVSSCLATFELGRPQSMVSQFVPLKQ